MKKNKMAAEDIWNILMSAKCAHAQTLTRPKDKIN